MEMKRNSDQLYGMRSIVIALVVASHCGFLKQGGLCVAVMFCLSGFLAVRPFDRIDTRFRSAGDILRYYFKKLLNIYPSFVIIMLGLKLLSDDYFFSWNDLLRMLLFIDGPVHLWYLQEQMTMYLVTPFILLLLHLFTFRIDGRKRYALLFVLSVLFTVIAKNYLSQVIIFHGNFDRPWYLYNYTIGIAYGYLFHYTKTIQEEMLTKLKRKAKDFAINLLTVILFLLVFISSDRVLQLINPKYAGYYIGWAKPFHCGILAGLFIFLISYGDNCLMSKLFRLPFFVFFGKISYEVYIIHWYLLSLLRISSIDYKYTLLVYICSAGVAFLANRASKVLVSHILMIKGAGESG